MRHASWLSGAVIIVCFGLLCELPSFGQIVWEFRTHIEDVEDDPSRPAWLPEGSESGESQGGAHLYRVWWTTSAPIDPEDPLTWMKITVRLSAISEYPGGASDSGTTNRKDLDLTDSHNTLWDIGVDGQEATLKRPVPPDMSRYVWVATFDWAGKGKIEAQAEFTAPSTTVPLPYDFDEDLLPDAWEARCPSLFSPTSADTNGNGCLDGAEDSDPRPEVSSAYPPAEGTIGDGLAAWEEYRGFYVVNLQNMGNVHIRTRPFTKDLLVLLENISIGYLANLPVVETHQVRSSHVGVGRIINFNNILPNASDAELQAKVDGTLQRCILMVGQQDTPPDLMLDDFLGYTFFRQGFNSRNGTPNEVISCEVFFDAYEKHIPRRVRAERGDEFLAKTAAHEAGHALSMEHYTWPDRAHPQRSIMLTGQRGFAHPPDTYDDVDRGQMRLHRKR